ncbi:MAG: hypothetical protein ABRQ38_10045 [Candidatus Eremiobacterota bacterium]
MKIYREKTQPLIFNGLLLTDFPTSLTERGSANFALPLLPGNVAVEGFIVLPET